MLCPSAFPWQKARITERAAECSYNTNFTLVGGLGIRVTLNAQFPSTECKQVNESAIVPTAQSSPLPVIMGLKIILDSVVTSTNL